MQLEKLRPREAKQFAKDHIAHKHVAELGSSPDVSASNSVLLPVSQTPPNLSPPQTTHHPLPVSPLLTLLSPFLLTSQPALLPSFSSLVLNLVQLGLMRLGQAKACVGPRESLPRLEASPSLFPHLPPPARQLRVLRPLEDVTITEGGSATFQLELSQEGVTGEWARGGVRLQQGPTCQIHTEGHTHHLVLSGLGLADSGCISFTADALRCAARLTVRGAASGTAACLLTALGVALLIALPVWPPLTLPVPVWPSLTSLSECDSPGLLAMCGPRDCPAQV